MPSPKPYLYKLDQDFVYQHAAFDGVLFSNEWVEVKGGEIRVKFGYAWNGCSPKFEVLGLWVVGTPEGRLHEGQPITYYASCVHDVLCQFRGEIDITQKDSVQVFSDLLKQVQFVLEPLYTTAVDWFGPQVFKGDVDG